MHTLRQDILYTFRTLAKNPGFAAPAVVIINQTMAERFWPGRDPIGQRLRIAGSEAVMRQVIGLVRNSKYTTIGEDPKPFLFLPFSQNSPDGRTMTFFVRSKGDPQMLMTSVRSRIQAFERVRVSVETMKDALSIAFLPTRFSATLLGVLGLIGLLLATVGVYGVVAYSVTQRTREFGVRIALGAQRYDIWKTALSRGMGLTAIGLALGLAGAAAASRILSSFLVGLSPHDPLTYVGASLVLLTAASVANSIPARRAMRVNPTQSLRHE